VDAPTLEREQTLWDKGYEVVAGLDEVGRGPLAGPVIAAAVVFPPGQLCIEGLNDSKLLTPLARERLQEEVKSQAIAWTLGGASVKEIDRLNIRRATILAMQRALARLPVEPEHVLVDGNPLPELDSPHDAIVKGDRVSQSIAAASVIAKCSRDRLMDRLAKRYPAFSWDTNKGYGTAAHLRALDELGPTEHHRKTFSPVAQGRLL
jgi:ribonuclease HII